MGKNVATVGAGNFYIVDANAQSYSAKTRGDSSALPQTFQILPGKNVTGRVYFELPWESVPNRLAISRENDSLPGESPISWALENHEKEFTERDSRFMGKTETIWKVK